MTARTLEYVDHRKDPAAWAASLGISREAVELYLASDVIDLHIDSFIWTRIFGYDLTKRHGHGALGARFYSQADLPRLREAQVRGGIWVVTTNPFRGQSKRPAAFHENRKRLEGILASCPNDVALVRTAGDYFAAKEAGKHAAWLGIQGGNALDRSPEDVCVLDDGGVVRVTLVHLSKSALGQTSAPSLSRDEGLSNLGRDYVRALNERRIFVDLAHIGKKGFFDAVEAHDKSQPLIVTHTGVSGVHKHWRNLDDDQIRAVTDTGGVIGVMYQVSFLGSPFYKVTAEHIVDHLDHIANVAGEDALALGSDWDGAIVPPRDMPTCLELPRLVEIMLKRKWSPERVQKALGRNFLRSLKDLRG